MKIENSEQVKRKSFSKELAKVGETFYIPLMQQFIPVNNGLNVLGVDCGTIENLLPFAKNGCRVVGIDKNHANIEYASDFFKENNVKANFIETDIFSYQMNQIFDIIILNDVIGCVENKQKLLEHVMHFLKPDGIIFLNFKPGYMPSGGRSHLTKNKFISFFPFIHFLPVNLYKFLLKYCFHEDDEVINKLLKIKSNKITIEGFREMMKDKSYMIKAEKFYIIDPLFCVRYNIKFRELGRLFRHIPYIRDFFTQKCFYILTKDIYHVQIISS